MATDEENKNQVLKESTRLDIPEYSGCYAKHLQNCERQKIKQDKAQANQEEEKEERKKMSPPEKLLDDMI